MAKGLRVGGNFPAALLKLSGIIDYPPVQLGSTCVEESVWSPHAPPVDAHGPRGGVPPVDHGVASTASTTAPFGPFKGVKMG